MPGTRRERLQAVPTFTLAELAALVGGRVEGDPARRITGAAAPNDAGPDHITFVFSRGGTEELTTSRAGAAVVPEGLDAAGRDVVVHRNPHVAMAAVLAAFHPEERPAPGVAPTAVVHPTVRLGSGVHVGPYAVIDADTVLGDGVVVGSGTAVGRRCTLGARTRLFPHTVLYDDVVLGARCVVHSGTVIGADGFGYTRADGVHVKVPQTGGVVVGDDVEIGSNSCIDRGTMAPTRIGSGTKVDNHVQVGHNCRVGERVLLCGQVGLAGSTTVEDDAVLGGQVGVSGHLTIGRGAMIGAKSGIIADVAPGARIAGYPALPIEEWRRSEAISRHLPEMRRELRRLQEQLERLDRERPPGNGGETH